MRDLITEPISDAGLLERFASHRDEAAFGELVKRHGPQVLKVCRRGLPSEHDVEDVFQATFFVLAHKAAAVSWNESVESWLCDVARRLVLHARASAWQRQSRERPITALGRARAEEYSGFLPDQDHPLYDPHEEVERRDIRRVLHAALGQLPEKYRTPSRTLLPRGQDQRGGRATAAPLSLGGSDEPGIAAPAITWDGQVSREREQVEALARKAQWVAEQTADQDPGRSSNSGSSTRRRCAWRRLILARRPGSAIGQPC